MKYIRYSLALVILAIAGVAASFSSPAAATGSGSRCLDPNDTSSYEASISTRNKGTISTRDGRPLCGEGKLALQSFNVPDTWNKRGWNTTAIPQTRFASTEFTFPANKSDYKMNVEVASPEACKHTQLDFYLAPGYKDITTLTGDDELNIIGVLFAATQKCEQPKPKEIEVCVLKDKTVKTIFEKDFDSSKYSKNLDDCKVEPKPKEIKVCVLKDKTVKTIFEKDFDSSKHSKNLSDCDAKPTPKGEDTPAPTEEPKGKDAPETIPSTGIVDVIGGVAGISSLAGAGYYYVSSRRRLMM